MNSNSSHNTNGVEILIVEDSLTQAEQLKYMLERHGYGVSHARNGKEAIVWLRAHKPTLIITDVNMPEMDGYQLCRRIRSDEKLQDLPVILLTGLTDPEDVIRGLECGSDNFITKPFEEGYLLARIRHILSNRHLHEYEKTRISLEVFFAGKKHVITADRLQILNLLLSTYETAVLKNRQLEKTQIELQKLNEELEKRVQERTAALRAENEERKRAEEALRASEEYARNIIRSSLDMIVAVDRERRITEFNEAAQRTFGYTHEEVLGQPADLLYANPEEGRFVHKTTVEKGRCVQEIQNRRKSGQVFTSLISSSPLRDLQGEFVGVMGVSRDITERKRAEEALRKSHEDYRRVIEDIFKFVPEALLVFAGNLSLYKNNKAFEDLVRTYASKLNYTEPELREILLQEIRAKVLSGDCGEMRIPPKNRDEKRTRGPDHSGQGAGPAAPQISGLS